MPNDIPQTPAVQASNENTSLILDRIDASEQHVKETFQLHEERDEERFDQTAKALVEHRIQLGEKLDLLSGEVKATNGGLKGAEAKIGIIEYGEALARKHAENQITFRQALIVAIATVIMAAALHYGAGLG